jgi:hypothetical protein
MASKLFTKNWGKDKLYDKLMIAGSVLISIEKEIGTNNDIYRLAAKEYKVLQNHYHTFLIIGSTVF